MSMGPLAILVPADSCAIVAFWWLWRHYPADASKVTPAQITKIQKQQSIVDAYPSTMMYVLLLNFSLCLMALQGEAATSSVALSRSSLRGVVMPQRRTSSSDASSSSNVLCRMTLIDTMYGRSDGGMRSEGKTACIPILAGHETDYLIPLELPVFISTDHAREIHRGSLYVQISNATLSGSTILLNNKSSVFTVQDAPPADRLLNGRTTGTKTLAIVRISTNDATPYYSLNQIQQAHFATDRTTFQSQFKACSFGKLQWEFAGSYDVMVDQSVTAFQDYFALIAAAEAQLQKTQGRSVSALGYRVMMVLPPGTGNWAASAGVNHYRLQMNDRWSNSLSATMHELGHAALGLMHANEAGAEYGDISGYMGSSWVESEWPRECYNG
jgi:Gametolysin peptidase M11